LKLVFYLCRISGVENVASNLQNQNRTIFEFQCAQDGSLPGKTDSDDLAHQPEVISPDFEFSTSQNLMESRIENEGASFANKPDCITQHTIIQKNHQRRPQGCKKIQEPMRHLIQPIFPPKKFYGRIWRSLVLRAVDQHHSLQAV
jgi:hypothetical protein